MLPLTEISIGDQFESPILRPSGLTFLVVDIKVGERMVKIQGIRNNGKKEG